LIFFFFGGWAIGRTIIVDPGRKKCKYGILYLRAFFKRTNECGLYIYGAGAQWGLVIRHTALNPPP